MRPGTIIKLPDGREATVVSHDLIGYGIIWGRVEVDVERILNTCSLFSETPNDWPWVAEAVLREPGLVDIDCVGTEYEIVEEAHAQ